MIAVKYREDYLKLSTPFNWPYKTRYGVTELPKEFDDLLTLEEYTTLLSTHDTAFKARKLVEQEQAKENQREEKLKLVKEKWVEMVNKYDSENLPATAQSIVDEISTGASHIPAPRLSKMRASLRLFVIKEIGIE